MIKDKLIQLGLTEKSAEIYLTLNKIGPSVASTLARLCKIQRTSVYDSLNLLLESDLIVSFKQGQLTYYAIDDTKKLVYHESEKIKIAEKIVEELKQVDSLHKGIQVNYYRDLASIRQMFDEILTSGTEDYLAWTKIENFYKAFGLEHNNDWTHLRAKKKIAARILIQDTKMGRIFQKDDDKFERKTILLPKEYMFDTTCILYKDNIIYLDSEEPPVVIRITNKNLYLMKKKMFEMCWKLFAK